MTREKAVHVTIVEDADHKKWKNVNYNCLFGVAISHLILGVAILCISAPMTHWKFELNSTGYGIWCAIVFLATGVVGVVSTKYKEYRSLVVLYMALCFLSVAGATIVIILTSIGHFHFPYEQLCHDHCGAKKAISAVQICFGGIELTIAVFTGLNILAEVFCHPAQH